MPFSADGSKWFKSYLQRKLFSLPDFHSAFLCWCGRKSCNGCRYQSRHCSKCKASTGKNRWLNLGGKQVPKSCRKVGWHHWLSQSCPLRCHKIQGRKWLFLLSKRPRAFAINKLYKWHFASLGFIHLGFKEILLLGPTLKQIYSKK